MFIRTEVPADILSIDALLKENSPDPAHSKFLMSLRENGHITLSLVACDDDGHLIAHVAFTPIVNNDGLDNGWQLMTAMTIDRSAINSDLHLQLVDEGITMLMEIGYLACFIYAESDQYKQLGFKLYDNHLWGFDNHSDEIESHKEWLKWINTSRFC